MKRLFNVLFGNIKTVYVSLNSSVQGEAGNQCKQTILYVNQGKVFISLLRKGFIEIMQNPYPCKTP